MRALECSGEQRASTIIRSGRLPFTSALRTISMQLAVSSLRLGQAPVNFAECPHIPPMLARYSG